MTVADDNDPRSITTNDKNKRTNIAVVVTLALGEHFLDERAEINGSLDSTTVVLGRPSRGIPGHACLGQLA